MGDEYAAKVRERFSRGVDSLDCSVCGKHICYVYDCDLNGSYFYCDDCTEKLKAEA